MDFQAEEDYMSMSQSVSQSASTDEILSGDEEQAETKRITMDGITYALSDYDYTATLVDCSLEVKKFEVPSNFQIGDDFYTVKDIGPRAFKNTKIEEISFRGDCSISSFARDSLFCHTLKTVVFPYQLRKLDQGWCSFTINLLNIDLSQTDKHFVFDDGVLYDRKKSVLYFCSRKKSSVIIPSSVKIIAAYAFEQCRRLETVKFEDQSCLEEIQPWAFSRSHLRSINVPKTVKEIHCNAFFWCKRLREVNFEEGSLLVEIHHAAFKETPLSEITLPIQTSKIGKGAFQNCTNLKELSIYHHGDLYTDKNAFKNVNEDFVLNISTQTKLLGKGYLEHSEKVHQFNE